MDGNLPLHPSCGSVSAYSTECQGGKFMQLFPLKLILCLAYHRDNVTKSHVPLIYSHIQTLSTSLHLSSPLLLLVL